MNTLLKRSLLGLALIGTLSTGMVMAQTPAGTTNAPLMAVQSGAHQGAWSQLNLTPDQQSQIKSIRQGFAAQRRSARVAFEQEAKLVLNQEQMARWQQMKQLREQHRMAWSGEKGNHKHHGRGHELQHLSRALNMSPEQKAQMQAYVESQMPNMRAERQAMRDEVRAVLTPAQQAQLDQMRHAHNHINQS